MSRKNVRARRRLHAAVVAVASSSIFAGAAHGATVSWVAPFSDSWNNAADWSSSPALPGLADDVVIDQPFPVSVVIDFGTQSVNSITDNNTLTLTNGSLAVATTLQVNGTFNLQGGTLQNTTLAGGACGSINIAGGTLSNDTLNGNVVQSTGGVPILLSGTITLNGNWTQSAGGLNALSIANNTTLAGNGTFSLVQCTLAGNTGNVTLAIGAGKTLQGSFAFNANVSVTNSGILNASTPLFTSGVTYHLGTAVNNGTLESSNGAALVLTAPTTGAIINNTNGTISASGAGSHTTLSNLAISGGQLLTDSLGQIGLGNATLSNVTAAGNLFFLAPGNISLSNDVLAGNVALATGSRIGLTGNVTNNANWTGTNSNLSVGNNIHFINNGAIVSTSGGTITLSSPGTGFLDNSNGTLSATASLNSTPSQLSFSQLAINGGQLSTDALGQITLGSGATLTNATISGNLHLNNSVGFATATLANDTLSGTVAQAGDIAISGTITNNAQWNTNGFHIALAGATALNGNGTLTLGSSIASNGNPFPFSIGSQQTIQGSGTINTGDVFANIGVVESSIPFALLTVFCANTTSSNNGTLQSSNGGSLALTGTYATTCVLNNTHGLISGTSASVNQASQVVVTGLTITGGQLSTDSASAISLNQATLANATVSGNLQLNSESVLADDTLSGNVLQNGIITISGNVTNNANWTQFATAASISLSSNVTLAGNGTLDLYLTNILSSLDTPTLTIGSQQILQGSGNIVASVLLNNAGTIDATDAVSHASPSTLTINYAAGNFTNAGLLESTGGGLLMLLGTSGSTLLDNSNGVIHASGLPQDGVSINGMVISGGLLTTDATSAIGLSGSTLANASVSGNLGLANATLSNDTLSGTVNQSGPVTLSGTINNNANWTQRAGSGHQITVSSNATLAGDGTLTMLHGTFMGATGPATLTLGANQTLEGTANSFGGMTIINNGTIIANGGTLSFAGPFTNNGSVDVAANSTFLLPAPASNLSNGTLTGGSWNVASAGILTLNANITTNAATITLDGSNASFTSLTNLTLNQGNLTITNGATFSPAANFTNAGNLTIGASSSFSAPQLLLNAGALTGVGVINAPVVAGAAPHTIHPGLPGSLTPGTLALQSLSTNANTVLAFNLVTPAASSASSVNDQLIVSSPNGLTLNGGTVQLTSAPAGTAALGYYQIMQYTGSISGSLSSLAVPASVGNWVYGLDAGHDPNFIDLHVGFLGDVNDDGKVDLSDLNIVLNNLGTANASWASGDFDGAATIDLTDLNDVLNNLGTTFAGGSAITSVPTPEPGSLALVGVGALLLSGRRRWA